MSPRRVLIVGGSTRAAADSVRRAGWQPVCADLFADQDLRSTAEVIPVRNYPFSLPDDIAHVKADAWFYCGALENQPDLIESLSARASSIGPLLGSSSKALRRVRNPFWLSNTLRFEGVPALAVVDQSTPPEPDGAWVQKPLASAGGRMVRVWDESAARIPFSEPHYFPRFSITRTIKPSGLVPRRKEMHRRHRNLPHDSPIVDPVDRWNRFRTTLDRRSKRSLGFSGNRHRVWGGSWDWTFDCTTIKSG